MFGHPLQLTCLLLGAWSVVVDAGGPDSLDGRGFSGFFNAKMIDAFANTSGLPFSLIEVPYEIKTIVGEGLANWNSCVPHRMEELQAAGGISERDLSFKAGISCMLEKKYNDLALFLNVVGAEHELRSNSTEKEDKCHREMGGIDFRQLFYLFDAKRLCQTLQFMAVPFGRCKKFQSQRILPAERPRRVI
ncbi:hypothetical protein M3Y99_01175100 [Aphelenchoides fujianensis]|nr:hypothetical protein M3Y99_01175100 [Aphelenchoides fujianensis]